MKKVADYVLSTGSKVVCVDEGQFFLDIAEWADFLAYQGVTVLVAALDSNFLNHPSSRCFKHITELLPRAEKIHKVLARCHTCFSKTAAFNLKRDPNLGNGTTDLIGGAEKYEAICRPCHKSKLEATGARPIPSPARETLSHPSAAADQEIDEVEIPGLPDWESVAISNEKGPSGTDNGPYLHQPDLSAASKAASPRFRQSSPTYKPPSPGYSSASATSSFALADVATSYKNLPPPGLARTDSQNNATTSSSMTDEQKARAETNRAKAKETRKARQAAAAAAGTKPGDHKRKRSLNPDTPRKRLAAAEGHLVATEGNSSSDEKELIFFSDDDDWDNPLAKEWDDDCLYSAIANEVYKLGLEKNPDVPEGQ